ncbi:MAG: hypothetical protein V1838_05980, partial [Patescibacteria group bacterium]
RSDVIWSTVIMVIVAGLIVKTLTLNYFTGIIFTLLAVCLSLGMVWQSYRRSESISARER